MFVQHMQSPLLVLFFIGLDTLFHVIHSLGHRPVIENSQFAGNRFDCNARASPCAYPAAKGAKGVVFTFQQALRGLFKNLSSPRSRFVFMFPDMFVGLFLAGSQFQPAGINPTGKYL